MGAAARAARPRPRLGPPPELRGATLPLWSPRPDLVAWASARLDEVVAAGGNAVQLVVLARQRDVTSAEVARSPSAPDDHELGAVIAAARERGLTVMLLPIIELEQIGDGQWRGTLRPADRDRWWTSYERLLLGYAELAEATKVDWLAVGSELGSTEGWQERWYHLISAARRRYRGKLLYSANWDRYDQVSFWRRLDAIGVSSYFSVATTDDDSAAQMALRWRDALRSLASAGRARELPVILTEVGIPSRDGAALAPWDYTRDGSLDLEEQRRAFWGLAAAWPGRPLTGALVWEIAGDGGGDDPGYSPRGKPAWCVLAAWWRAKAPCAATRTDRR